MNRATSVIFCSLWLLVGCENGGSGVYREGLTTPDGEPAYITVQHCLIGFRGSVQGKSIARSPEEAEQLALELFERAKQGENFDALVTANTNDSPPGIYKMANFGFPGDTTSPIPSRQVHAREQMVAAFGDTGFPLEVGEIGLAAYDPQKSPFGWHIVKRIK
jgi:hypothetical protein